MKRIAVCVLTYNHPDVVNDVLDKSIKDYHACGIDVYYYDSSEGNETELVVKRYQDAGFDNLYYLKIPSEVSVAEKTLLAFKGEGLEKQYDYIWPVKDRVYCPRVTIEYVLETAEENYDSIFLGVMNTGNNIQIGTTTYEDATDFYRDWGWFVTSLDVTIYNKKFMLDDISVTEFRNQYLKEFNASWYHYIHFFNKIAQIDNLKIRLLRDGRTGIYNSPLGKSSWTKDMFKIWQESWIKVNLELPECYNEYKYKVIKEASSLPWLLGSVSKLIELYNMGALSLEVYDVIKDDWHVVSDIPLETVYQIASGTYDVLHDVKLLEKSNDEMLQLVIRCIDMIENDRLPKETIPFGSIEKYIMGKGANKLKITQDEYYIFCGSVRDVKKIILDQSRDKRAVIRAMQLYISYLVLIGN